MVSPMQCRVITEVMPTWRALWRQRMRWQRGALENIGAYGLTRATLQVLAAADRHRLRDDRAQRLPAAHADHAARRRQLRARLVLGRHRHDLRRRARRHGLGRGLARRGCSPLPLVIEIGYDLVLQAVYVKSLFDIATGREAGWNYVPREMAPREAVRNDHPGRNPASSSVLHSGWFQALAAFVAINTLVYAALSLAKLIPRRRA